jgi:ribosomal protein S27AE
MTGQSSSARRPERLTTHLAAPGARITPAPGIRRWDYGADRCNGDVRALYSRDAKRAWQRAGWVCTRCGTVELEPGLIGTERDRWYARDRARLDPEHSYAGRLVDVDGGVDTAGQAAGVDTAPRPRAGVDTNGQLDPHTAAVLARDRTAADVARELEDSVASLRAVHVGARAAAGDGVDTPAIASVSTPSAGWDPLAKLPCPSCGKGIAASNLAKHRKRVHP